jgi:hypothetical protein
MPTLEYRKSFIQTANKLNQEMVILLSNNDKFTNINKSLHAFIHKRIDSLLILIQHDCLWDADIILSPIVEASVKINFIACGSEIEKTKLDKSYNMVNSHVQNRRQPSIEDLYKIAELLNVDARDLLTKSLNKDV